MGMITDLIETAESYIGTKEGSKKYTELIKAFEETGLKYDGQGCCEIVTGLFIKTYGLSWTRQLIPISNYAYGQSKKWKLEDTPKPGCIAYFGSGDINHEELVLDVRGNKLTTLDGNFNHQIVNKTRYLNDKQLKGFGIPDYYQDKVDNVETWTSAAIKSISIKKGAAGPLVLWLEEFLTYEGLYTGYWDGVFGDMLEKAVRAYQKKHKLLVDGICGRYFWSEVLL